MVCTADVEKGSVFKGENLERNFNFEASKARKLTLIVSYLYTKYLLYWMVYQSWL